MDINILGDIGRCQNHQLVIDSSTRDKAKWPTPSEYRINLDNPIENIIGVDIVDASIPNSTYIVDDHNNQIGFGIRVSGSEDAGFATRRIEEFSDSKLFSDIMQDKEPDEQHVKITPDGTGLGGVVRQHGTGFFVTISRSFTVWTPNASDASSLETAEGEPVPIDKGVDIEETSPGFWQWRFMESTGASASPWYRAKTIISTMGIVVCSVKLPDSIYAVTIARVEDMIDTPLYDVVGISNTAMGASVRGKTTVSVSSVFYNAITDHLHELELHNFDIETGNLDIFHLAAAITYSMPTYFPTTALSYSPCIRIEGTSPTTPANYAPRGKFAFRSRDFFWIDGRRTTAASVIGFAEPSRTDRTNEYRKINVGPNVFGSVEEVAGVNNFVIYTPGIINLQGVPYVKIRCPEVEEHFRALNHGSILPGLGVLPLREGTNSRLDYNSYRTNLPHPIARITRLTFRFERPDGKPYDFKGIDHSFLLTVRTMMPTSSSTERVTSSCPLFA